jgi:hypothetical protein
LCIGTATLVLTGGGAASGGALAGFFARKTRVGRFFRSLRLKRIRAARG